MKHTLLQALLALLLSINSAYPMPMNFSHYLQTLKHYYDSGAYQRDVDSAVEGSERYLQQRLTQPLTGKNAIVFDIDETALSNAPALFSIFNLVQFSGDRFPQSALTFTKTPFHDPAIESTLALYRYAKAHHITPFFLSGRTEADRAGTIENLHASGYHGWQQLILRAPGQMQEPAAVYKTHARASIEKAGYHIIENIGDQVSDLAGGHADHTTKLPNPFYETE